jgi:hypothetical protein
VTAAGTPLALAVPGDWVGTGEAFDVEPDGELEQAAIVMSAAISAAASAAIRGSRAA